VSPDGLTYYIGDIATGRYHAVDITNSTKPRMVASFDMKTVDPRRYARALGQRGR